MAEAVRETDPTPAPAWFRAALAEAAHRTFVQVEGVAIEALEWGNRGRPGVLLLHGFSAHADWWSFVAPLLARDRHVVALSFSGMGRSGWREAYSLALYAREALGVAESVGLFESPTAPLLVGHSFGSFVARAVALRAGARLGGVIAIDGVLPTEDDDTAYDGMPRRGHRHRVYPTVDAARARFRFSPPQACQHEFIVDHVARTSLRSVRGADGLVGWSWCFDPDLRAKLEAPPDAALLSPLECPLALMFGRRSALLTAPRRALLRRATPADTPWIEIEGAGHHVMVDQPLALVAALDAQVAAWRRTEA